MPRTSGRPRGHLVDGLAGRSRAFVQVQNGCDHRCTFCIIPYGRGPSRSVPVGEVVAQTRHLVENGHKEVVLTGVDLTSYGRDLPGQPPLGQLARRLLKLVPELPRLRLSSIDPAEVDPDLFDLIASEPRLMPHLHLSVQAGDTLTLKRMKRRHTRDDVITLTRICKGLRPEIAFGADLIAGFPTETDAMFENTLRLVEEAELTYLHIFPYSAREGTPAARMPQLPKAVAKERASRLRAEGERVLARFLDHEMTRRAMLLVEQSQGGHTETFAPFRFAEPANAPAPGSLAPVVADRGRGRHAGRATRGMSDGEGGETKQGWFQRLKSGLSRSSANLQSNIASVFTGRKLDAASLEELEEALIAADMGVETAMALSEGLKDTRFGKDVTEDEVRQVLAGQITQLLEPVAKPLVIDPAHRPEVILVCGVNGTGKTTTIGKLAQQMVNDGKRVMLAAGDTFRAAAIEQLEIWGRRTDCSVIAKAPGADAAGLAFEALEKARAEGADVLLIDTAGRLHNKSALMDELAKIVRVLKKQDEAAPHQTLWCWMRPPARTPRPRWRRSARWCRSPALS